MGKRLIIIGGVAGGATAAARARRLDESAEIILFERGEYISFANCGLPYYIGHVITELDDLLLTTPEAFSARYNIDIRNHSEVTAIDRKNKTVSVTEVLTQNTYKTHYDKIILSPGAEPLKPPIPGIELPHIYSLRNIPDADRIKALVDSRKPETAVVVGGGFIGIEMAENLVEKGVKTFIVEQLDQVMAPLDHEMAATVHAILMEKGVVLELENGVSSFSQKEDQLMVSTAKGSTIACDMVILAIGVRPENRLALSAGLAVSEKDGIKVNASMQTSDPDIYAVGDAVEVFDMVTGMHTMTALAGPANKQGRIAADNAMGRKSVFRGTMGTAVLKLFDSVVASTGPSERALTQHNIPCLTSFTHSGSHASYYPGAETMAIKLIFSPGTGRVLGAQIIGKKGVDKRIDVIATAIRGSMTVYDLEELELAYAPPFSSAKDPVNVAGFVAANILKGDLETLLWHQLEHIDPDKEVVIDVRTEEEIQETKTIKGALHIHIDDLRSRLSDLDRQKTYIVFCAVGLRGYIGYRILAQSGFKAKSVNGGYSTCALTAPIF